MEKDQIFLEKVRYIPLGSKIRPKQLLFKDRTIKVVPGKDSEDHLITCVHFTGGTVEHIVRGGPL